ncbi:hypothetical protein FJ661_20035 [Pseudarthrobacter phenanthrenivorans]|uniref:hypothetical protein n=1 Tax=Pseudarthrobacter phenanthrenivorans TaxID=361575 RepID=UPI0011299265|nr:hypothetical protein [Pseudarthrobacter phenanthrenivorans]TPV47810.1 hypothetical protein FJ661_20035 [Pseudarthrobacter phenanthrenivorans]
MMYMEIDDNHDRGDVVESTRPSGGLYSLPVVGRFAAGTRQFYDEMAPQETDSAQARIAKEVFRWSSAAAGAAAVAVMVL